MIVSGNADLLAAEDIDGEVLQHDGEPDRADERRERAVLRHRADRDEHREDADDRARDHRPGERAVNVGAGVDHQEQADEGADHEDFAMREIKQAQHAEDQRVADRHQRVGRAEHQAVDQLLVNHAGRERCAMRIIGTAFSAAMSPRSRRNSRCGAYNLNELRCARSVQNRSQLGMR